MGWSQRTSTKLTPTADVPEAAKIAQNNLFPEDYVNDWSVHSESTLGSKIYIANFKVQGEEGHRATYTDNGLFVFKSQFLKESLLPSTTIIKARNEFDNYTIQSGYKFTLPNPDRVVYRVDLLDGSNLQYAYYSENGIRIPKSSLPLELRLFEN